MPTIFNGQTAWAVVTIVLAVVLSVVTIVVAWDHARRRARLPDATRFENLREQVATIDVTLRERQEQLREIDQKIHNRDRIAAEVAALTERLENLRAEFAALAGAEQQIEAMKQRAAETAGAFAIETGRLDEMKLALQEATAALTDAQARLDRLQKDADALEARKTLSRDTLPGEIERLQATLADLAKRKDVLDLEISDLKGVRESLFAARAETAALAARNDALEARYQELRDALPGEIERLQATLADLAKRKDVLDLEVSDLKGVRESLFAARAETATLAARNDALEARYQELRDALPGRINEMMDQLVQLRGERDALEPQIGQLQMARDALLAVREELAVVIARSEAVNRETDLARQTRDDLLGGQDLADARRELSQVGDEVAALRAERASLEQMATRAALEAEIAQLRREAGGFGAGEADATAIAADLAQLPGCLLAVPSRQRDPQLEDQALFGVEQYLGKLGLKYDRRTLYAFHTALKINETSQMTVLAGVSGTGKSLLPRRYAEAMGLRFLQISVEPRWDSPQDLLGFYNYIEKRYRATDLARALVHMDPYNTSRLSDGGHEDEMMLVLLDEMNLARVEYYFSEFLSRLEVRPRIKETDLIDRRLGACLSIDIPGRSEKPIQLFPSYNVLFAGTMNDDESTQMLSDKVLDRSNVMQFAAPDGFARPNEDQVPTNFDGMRSFREWQKWIKPTDRLVGGDRDKARRVIDLLAKVMDRCGRPFGHRLNEAILAYVANYPYEGGTAVDVPLADQIELRILPKLRGLPIQDNEQPLTDLAKLISEDLRDPDLARALNDTLERQRGNNQFNWRGFNRAHG
jgi:uncharacterized coiled-coil DUF342 family protein